MSSSDEWEPDEDEIAHPATRRSTRPTKVDLSVYVEPSLPCHLTPIRALLGADGGVCTRVARRRRNPKLSEVLLRRVQLSCKVLYHHVSA